MDSLNPKQENILTLRSMAPRILKAFAKTAIAYFSFTVFSMIVAPVQSVYSLEPVFTAFFAAYLLFIFVIEITRGTIYQHMFGIASSLTVVMYFAYMLSTSVISFSVEQFSLTVDLRFFFYVLLMGGVLGFAKSILQLLNWVNEKEENWLSLHVKSL